MLHIGNVDDWITPEDLAGGEIAKPHLGRSGSIVTTSPHADSSESSSRYLQGDVIATNAEKTAAMYIDLDTNLCVDDFATGESYMVDAEDSSLVDFADLLNVAFCLEIRFSGNEIYEDYLTRLVSGTIHVKESTRNRTREAVELKVGDTVKWWDGGLAPGHGRITKEYKIDGRWQVYDVEWNDGTTSEEITSANLRKVRLVPKHEPQYYQNQWRPTESVRKNRRAMHEAGESETTSGYDKAKLGAALNAASRKITPARFFKMLKEAGMSDTDIYNFQEYLADEEQIFEEDYSEADLALHGSEWLTILGDYEGVEVDWDNCKDLDKEIEKYLWKYSEDNYQNRAKAITAEYCEDDIFYIYYLSQEGDSEEILEDIENMPFIEALVDAGYTPEVYVDDRDANHSVVIAHYKDGKWLDGDAGEEEVSNVDLVKKCWPNLRGENIDLIADWYDEEGGEFDEGDFMDMLWASSYDDDEVVALQQDLIDCGYYEADDMPHDFTGEKVTLEDWCWDNKLDSVAAEQFKKYLDKVGVLGDKDMPPEEFEELYIKFQNAKIK